MKAIKIPANIKRLFAKPYRKWWYLGFGALLIALYGVAFFVPKSVQFSYASSETCASRFVIAPNLQKVNSAEFTVQLKGEVKVGPVVLATTQACVAPKVAPEKGTFTATIAPFGGWMAQTTLAITVPDSPVARSSDLVSKSISTAQPLNIGLTSADAVHDYSLKITDKTAKCSQRDAVLSCDVASLGLDHSTEYTAALYQGYKGKTKKLVEGTVATLRPLVLTGASITNDQTIYDTPTSFTFEFDQPVKSAQVKLVKVNGETTEEIKLTDEIQGSKLTVQFATLPREVQYRLEILDAIAENGSSLAEPITTAFKTSGGPKVTGVSVGGSNVPRSAQIIVTFDQPIAADVDVAALARAQGTAATVSRQSDTQLVFAIQAGDCASFTLTVDKGVKSGSNGELSKEAWSFSSRVTCGYSWSIGTSVKGRPITAYSFGSGANVILFTGAIHGNEPSGYSTMLGWAQYLQANGNIIPADKRIVIVPNTNPDGIAAGSRNNNRNVNLGRNFPTANWKAAIETASGVLPTGGGTSAGSEPEAAALIALTRQLRPRLEVSFHAQGSLVGANKFGDSVSVGNIYANTVGYRTMYYDAEAVMGYPMTGEYEDWMGEEMGIPAILVELPTLSGNYLNSQLAALKKMINL